MLQELETAGRSLSAATIMFHTAVSARLGLNPTEEKALDLLDRCGPLTATQLARQSGLAPASVTGLVDRLESKGFASRRHDPNDRRRVLIETSREQLRPIDNLFAEWSAELAALYERYSDEQLETILDFMETGARLQRAATARLSGAVSDEPIGS